MIIGTLNNIVSAFFSLFSKNGFYAKNTSLLSNEYQHESGDSISEYYFDRFMKEHVTLTGSKVLTIDQNSTIELSKLESNSYDSIILKDCLNFTYDYRNYVKECYRLLKKGGTLVATVSSISVGYEKNKKVWGLTENGMREIFAKFFTKNNLLIKGYGNVLAGRYLLANKSTAGLTKEQLDHYDAFFTITVGVKAVK